MSMVRRVLWELWLPVLLVAIWWIASANSTNFYFPPLADIMDEFVDIWFFEGIRTEIWPSVQRLAMGFGIAVVAGVVLGMVLGVVDWLDNAVRPIVEFLRATPGVAILPVMVLLLGLGTSMKVGIIALVATWPILLNTIDGVRSVEPVLRQVAASHRLKMSHRIRFIILPNAAPQIFAGARTALAISVVAMVISEMVGTPGGIGYFILDAQRRLQHGGHVDRDHRARHPRLPAQQALRPRRGPGPVVAPRHDRPQQRRKVMTVTTENTAGQPAATSDTPVIQVQGLGHAYGPRQIFEGLEFSVGQGEFVCIVGPSGVGKTTLLQSLTGLLQPSQGAVVFEGRTVKSPPEGLAIVFQDYSRSLMPWLSVLDNVALPLRSMGIKKAERVRMATEALTEVGLRDVTDAYPWQLSGGMQQRVAIARALACQPRAIVMDEPFASVDAQTRAELEDLVLRVRDHLGITVMLVTHDIDEAVYLADTVLVLSGKPATVSAMIPVELPVPRHQLDTKALPKFAELRTEVYRLIKNSGAPSASA